MIYATVAIGLLAACAVPASADGAGTRALLEGKEGKKKFEFKKFKLGGDKKFEKDDKGKKLGISDGDEDDEGNEGFNFFKKGGLSSGDDEGNEGDEGFGGPDVEDEGDEGDEGDIGGDTDLTIGTDDDNEGDEGDEGSFGVKIGGGKTVNKGGCKVVVAASAWSAAKDAHVSAIAEAFSIGCHPKFGDLYWPKDMTKIMDAAAFAAAEAIAAAAAKCVTTGNAFACAGAKAQAAAWAAATAEAHAEAYAYAYNACGCKKPDTKLLTEAGAEANASTFIQLTADVYASAEVEVCAKGDQVSSAAAFTKCFALAQAKVWTQAIAEALISGHCLKTQKAVLAVEAITKAEFLLIEGCSTKDGAKGDAGSETGTGAQAEAKELDLKEH